MLPSFIQPFFVFFSLFSIFRLTPQIYTPKSAVFRHRLGTWKCPTVHSLSTSAHNNSRHFRKRRVCRVCPCAFSITTRAPSLRCFSQAHPDLPSLHLTSHSNIVSRSRVRRAWPFYLSKSINRNLIPKDRIKGR